jgi:DNA-directed RNA polymerase specialized sigma24 family protein
LDTKEIVIMCEKLANRYRRPHLRDDIISEGILAIYERLNVEPEEYPASLYRRANKAMYDYINIKSKAINIPTNAMAGQLSRGIEYDGQNYSEEGKKNLSDAILSTVVGFDEEYMTAVQDCTDKYERQDYIDKAIRNLTERERQVILMR